MKRRFKKIKKERTNSNKKKYLKVLFFINILLKIK